MTAQSINSLVARIVALPRPLLLAFDVDGTLAPIVDDPAQASVPRELCKQLERLGKRRGVRVALVTGRDALSLGRVVRLSNAYRAVEHGRVIVPPGERPPRAPLNADERERLARFDEWVHREAVPRGGGHEIKATSRAVHVRVLQRRDPEAAQALLHDAKRAAERAGLSPRMGRAVLEAELSSGDKGEALLALLRRTRARGVMYVGDDLTDRPAIAAAVEHGGLGLFVRSTERRRAPHGASGSLDGNAEVAQLIAALCEELAPEKD